MTIHPQDLFELIKKMRMDMSQLQARLTDLSEMLSAMNLPEPSPKTYRCGECDEVFKSDLDRRFHSYREHPRPKVEWVMPDVCIGTEHITGKPCPACRKKAEQAATPEAALATTTGDSWENL